MWRPYIIIVVILFTAAVTSGCNKKQAKVQNVMDIMENPQPFQAVSVIGVVASVSSNPNEFTLMNVADAQNNKPVRDTQYLRIISNKRAPMAGVLVKVTGQLMEHGMYVNATKVKRWKLDSV